MFFPIIKDIATTDIISIDISETVCNAIELMVKSHHRALVVHKDNAHFILLAQDLLLTPPSEIDQHTTLHDCTLHELPSINKDNSILEAVSLINGKIEYIAAVDQNHDLFGLVTHRDLIDATDPEVLMQNYSIGEVIKSHRTDIWVEASDITAEVIFKMHAYHKDCATVIKNRRPVGIFTIKDILTQFKKHQTLDMPIGDVMTQPVITVQAQTSLKEAIDFIKKQSFKRLVVVDDNDEILGLAVEKDLIGLAYSSWSSLMQRHQKELMEINQFLSEKANRYQQLATIDPLTKLFNRSKFLEFYHTENYSMQEREQPMSLLMLDVDFFKHINDTYGHNSGDDILVELAQILKQCLRGFDIISRWGGEEFMLLLPTADLAQAKNIAEKIRLNIAQHEFKQKLKIQVSIGVHEVDDRLAVEDNIARVDQALYQAKNSGRNQVATYTDQQV